MILTRLIAALARGAGGRRRAKHARSAMNEAEAHLGRGDAAQAEAQYLHALALDPRAAAAHVRLGLLLTAQRRYDEALDHLRSARACGSLPAAALETLVHLLLQRGELTEAAHIAEEVTSTHPGNGESWFSLARVRQREHRYADALECCDKAIALDAGNADFQVSRAIALQNLGRLPEAHAQYERALQIRPGHALARFHRSLAWLVNGDYAAGWPEYETRLASADLPRRPRSYPRWDGGDPAGRRVLVYGEQGLGDEIMFASCIPDLLRSGARAVIECHPALDRLFARSFPQACVYPAAPDKAVPDGIHALGIDAEVPIGSLPLRYRTSAAEFPPHQGYLHADPDRVAAWHERLATLGPGPKIGLSWRGGTQASRMELRSLALQSLLPVLQLPGLSFVSLQYTPDAVADTEALSRQHGVVVAHWPEAIADYDETAALTTALDLTISVCTSIVHLTGALGRPVWVLAPKNAEWRYGNAGTMMPWYPSARVFRQERERDWSDVLAAVQRALEDPAAWNARGTVRLGAGELRGAQACFEHALTLAPGLAESHNNLGIALVEQGSAEAGERYLRQAIAIDPQLSAARENLAAVLTARFDAGAAQQAWNDVLALDEAHAGAHAAKAFLAMREGCFAEARALTRRALELGADRAPLLMQEASMLALEGRIDAAEALLEELRSGADPVSIDWELAMCALTRGDFGEGWPLYETRLRLTAESPRRPYRFPEWDAARVREGALLIMGEQGLGDEIMFASCYPDAIERAGRCVIECEPRLARLFARSFAGGRVVAQPRHGANPGIERSTEVACQVHAGSLPLIFRRTRDAFPRHGGYLRADDARVEEWRARLRGEGGMRWVGVAWSGGLAHTRRSIRSLAPAAFATLLRVHGIGFVSLQHDDEGAEAGEIAAHAGVPVRVFPEAHADLDDTAALVSSLDCVLTVCSTVVHLAGALGTPTLVLTPAWPEWRYLREGASLPWYPSVRLLRQRVPGDWAPVIDEAREALFRLASGGDGWTGGGDAPADDEMSKDS